MSIAEGGGGPGFNPLIHVPLRLRLTSMLAGVGRMAFPELCSALGVSKSVLSKHARVLREAGYVELVKIPQDASGTRVWVELTAVGRTALDQHLAALEAIAALARESRPAPQVDT